MRFAEGDTVTDFEGLTFERDGGVATITFNRPERLNAIRWTMIEGITHYAKEVASDDDVRVLVITGNGRAFSSGDDIVNGMGDRPGLVRSARRHEHQPRPATT